MKKLIPILLALALLVLTACGEYGEIDITVGPSVTETSASGTEAGEPAAETETRLAASVRWDFGGSMQFPVGLIGHTVAQADEAFGASGSGLPCADGGWLRDWQDAMGKVFFSTHDKDDSEDAVISTLYCTEAERTVAPGLKIGGTYTDYRQTFAALTACTYDAHCGYYTCGFDAANDSILLHVTLYFYYPDDVCNGITVSTRELGDGIPAIASDDRSGYPALYLNRSYADATAQFGEYTQLSGDGSAPSLVFINRVDASAPVEAGSANVKIVRISDPALQILPGVVCGLEATELKARIGAFLTEDDLLMTGSKAEILAEMAQTDSVYCGTYRFGALNAECYATFDDSGALTSWVFLAKALY
ncbi:MAG: hypothetical protein IK080_12055 [Clostridia bacterium]|nr:hypothetical protein [Clostridia bacterium]